MEKPKVQPVTMQSLVDELDRERLLTADAARPEAIARQHGKGKLSARERLAALLDPGSFGEIGGLARDDETVPRNVAPADGIVAGFGRIDGRDVGVAADDFTTSGGSSGTTGMRKSYRLTSWCLENGRPSIRLGDSGGHRIQTGLDSRHFAGADEFGNMRAFAAMSGYVPTVSLLLGPAFAGPANAAALSDFVVLVRGIAQVGIAGPALVKSALNISLTNEELGGADQQSKNGIVHIVTDTEAEAFAVTRRYLSYLPSNCNEPAPRLVVDDPTSRKCDDLLSIVPAEARKAYDVRKVIACVADQGSVLELRPVYAKNMVTALGRLGGIPVGFVANNPMFMAGTIDAAACEKCVPFITMCDAYGLPLVFLIDTPGFMVGPEAEKTGLARRVGNMLHTLTQITVPRANVVMRKAYGLGYLAMAGGRAFEADTALAWPTAEMSAMSVPGAVDIAYRRDFESAPDPTVRRREIIDDFMGRTGAIYGAEHFGVDDIIDPRDTRTRLCEAFLRAAPRRQSKAPNRYRWIAPV